MFRLIKLWVMVLICLALHGTAVLGEEISIPPIEAVGGEEIDIPIMLDQTDNLAGMKLALAYNPEFLVFKKAVKTPQTSSLMHIVNDKNPGSLIIVMAGARGIKGKDFSLMTLKFRVKNSAAEKITALIKVKEIELMNDKLKALDAEVQFPPVSILPAASKKKGETKF